MEEIASKLTTSNVRIEDFKEIKSQEEMKSAVKVSDMAEILVSKFKNNCDQPPPEPVGRKVVSSFILTWKPIKGSWANSTDLDQMPHNAASIRVYVVC